MKKKTIILIVVIFILVVFLFIVLKNPAKYVPEQNVTRYSNYSLPINQRNFYMGLVPSPKSIPETKFEDLVAAYEETGKIAEVVMVWPEIVGIGEYDKLSQSKTITAVRVYGLKPVITLNFATIKQINNSLEYVIDSPQGIEANLSNQKFRELWVEEAKKIAQEFKPEYFSLGNEINDYFYLHPEQLDSYISLYDSAYSEIKKVSPNTKVFVVFSYNHLIDNNQWNLFEKFNNRVDLIGLTTYPWKHFSSPEEIDENYYSKLNQYTTKPIAFTEIGWVSTKSEKEQAEFLVKFLNLTKEMNLEMVNWLFLHEIELSGIIASISDKSVGIIALKRADGTKKEIYNVWLDLKNLKLAK